MEHAASLAEEETGRAVRTAVVGATAALRRRDCVKVNTLQRTLRRSLREVRLKESADQEEIEGRPDDLPDDVPVKVTIKQISDNRYYWQWREGDSVKSKHKRPVNPGK